jgi:hypothetical protein
MKNLKHVKEVSAIDQFIAVMDFLNTMGYDTSKLSVMDVASLKYDIVKAINESEIVEHDPVSDKVTTY